MNGYCGDVVGEVLRATHIPKIRCTKCHEREKEQMRIDSSLTNAHVERFGDLVNDFSLAREAGNRSRMCELVCIIKESLYFLAGGYDNDQN